MTAEIAQFLKGLPWDDLREAYFALLDSGKKPGEAARTVARTVDGMIDFAQLVHGPAGAVLETLDRTLIRIAVTVLLSFAKARPTVVPE